MSKPLPKGKINVHVISTALGSWGSRVEQPSKASSLSHFLRKWD